MVLSLPGSGSSAVAGVLHHLGVMMGETLVGADRSNPTGHYEDQNFRQLLYRYRKDKLTLKAMGGFLESRFAAYKIWGLKEPALLEAINELAASLNGRDARFILTMRDKTACVRSYQAKISTLFGPDAVEQMGATTTKLMRYFRNMEKNRRLFIKKHKPKVLRIAFNTLTADVVGEVGRIAEFAFKDRDPPSEDRLRQAIGFVDPRANRHRELGGPGYA